MTCGQQPTSTNCGRHMQTDIPTKRTLQLPSSSTKYAQFLSFQQKRLLNSSNYYRPQRSWGKVMFLQASVILLTGGVLSQQALHIGIPACLAAGLQGGVPLVGSAPGGSVPGGCLVPGESAPGKEVPGPTEGLLLGGCGLLLWPSAMAFCYGLLLWSSVMPFCYGLLVWWPSD